MKLSVNNKLISRNQKVSQIILYTALALLALGFVWSIRNPDASNVSTPYLILAPAYMLVQVSIFMANKWSRSPRPDEIVASSLKGLNNQFTLYNYTTSVPHLLVGPAGVWIIKPYYHSGEISYNQDKNRYDQKGGPGFFAKIFAQEGLPSIEHEASTLMKKFQKYVESKDVSIDVEPQIIHLFYSEDVKILTKNPPDLIMPANKIKDFIRQTAKKTNMSAEKINAITAQLPEAED